MGKILITALAAAALILAGCNTTGCLENQSSIPLAGFYSSADSNAITVDSISIYGVGAPQETSLIKGVKASRVYLPLRSPESTTSFCFRYLQKNLDIAALNDTITLNYTSEPRFVSEECGAMYFYHITSLTYTTHLIDSVALTDSLINNFDTERIKIFFRTSTPEEPADTTTTAPEL